MKESSEKLFFGCLFVPPSKNAFTLAELLLASAILAFALSGLLALFTNCIVLSETGRNSFVTLHHGELIMEEIKNTDFSNISNKIQNGDWDWDAGDIVSQGLAPLTNEQIDTSVSGSDVLDITVNVTWLDRGARSRNLSLTTKMVSP